MDVIPREVFCFGEYAKPDERSTVGDKPLEMAPATWKVKSGHGDLPLPQLGIWMTILGDCRKPNVPGPEEMRM